AINDGHNTMGFQFPAGEAPPLPGEPKGTPHLTISKSASAGAADPGALLTYTITAANTGTAGADNAQIVNTLPTDATVVSTGTTATIGTTSNQTTVTYTIGTLSTGETVTREITVQFSDPSGTCHRSNRASVTSSNATAATSNDAPVTVGPCLVLDKTGPASAFAGDEITYSVVVTNAEGSEGRDVVISDSVVGGGIVRASVLTPTSTPCTFASPSQVTCRDAVVPVGGTVTATIVVTSTVESVTNAAGADASNGAPTQPDEVVTTIEPSADLSLTKTASPAIVSSGGQITFTIDITNTGPSAAVDLLVSDTLGPGLQIVNLPNGCVTDDGMTITCTISSLAAGAS